MIDYVVACEYYDLNPSLEDKEKRNKIKLKHPGAFTDYCKRNGFKEVNCDCICKALQSKNKLLRKRANFARNFSHKECKCNK